TPCRAASAAQRRDQNRTSRNRAGPPPVSPGGTTGPTGPAAPSGPLRPSAGWVEISVRIAHIIHAMRTDHGRGSAVRRGERGSALRRGGRGSAVRRGERVRAVLGATPPEAPCPRL